MQTLKLYHMLIVKQMVSFLFKLKFSEHLVYQHKISSIYIIKSYDFVLKNTLVSLRLFYNYFFDFVGNWFITNNNEANSICQCRPGYYYSSALIQCIGKLVKYLFL